MLRALETVLQAVIIKQVITLLKSALVHNSDRFQHISHHAYCLKAITERINMLAIKWTRAELTTSRQATVPASWAFKKQQDRGPIPGALCHHPAFLSLNNQMGMQGACWIPKVQEGGGTWMWDEPDPGNNSFLSWAPPHSWELGTCRLLYKKGWVQSQMAFLPKTKEKTLHWGHHQQPRLHPWVECGHCDTVLDTVYSAVTFLLGAASSGQIPFICPQQSEMGGSELVGCHGECMALELGEPELQSWLNTYVIAGSLLPFPFTFLGLSFQKYKEGIIILIFHVCFKNSR